MAWSVHVDVEVGVPEVGVSELVGDGCQSSLATGIHETKEITLGLDIGTNTEISLAVDDRLLSCSCASGPAFEGAHIRDGMRAAPGAIEWVRLVDDRVPP